MNLIIEQQSEKSQTTFQELRVAELFSTKGELRNSGDAIYMKTGNDCYLILNPGHAHGPYCASSNPFKCVYRLNATLTIHGISTS